MKEIKLSKRELVTLLGIVKNDNTYGIEQLYNLVAKEFEHRKSWYYPNGNYDSNNKWAKIDIEHHRKLLEKIEYLF